MSYGDRMGSLLFEQQEIAVRILHHNMHSHKYEYAKAVQGKRCLKSSQRI